MQEPDKQTTQPEKVNKPTDKTNLFLGLLCLTLSAAVFALIFAYMNLSTEHTDLNSKYDQLLLSVNQTTVSSTQNANKEISTPKETSYKDFEFTFDNLLDTANGKANAMFNGQMPSDTKLTTISNTNEQSATLTNDRFKLKFVVAERNGLKEYQQYDVVDGTGFGVNGFGKMAFVPTDDSNSQFKLSGEYISMEFNALGGTFETTGECKGVTGVLQAPCGPTELIIQDLGSAAPLFVLNVTCEANTTDDFQICHDIVKSIEFEEVE